MIILAPVLNLPPELERLFVVIDHDLPDRAQLEAIARGTAVEPGELPEGHELPAVLEAAAGLTRLEAENAFALSLVRHGRLEPRVLWELKAQTLRKSGLLTLHKGGERFDELGGLDALKRFCTRALRPDRPKDVTARGILLLGPPGTGKSAFAKGLGTETGRPTLILDVGSLMGSLVGQTESNIRQALRLIDAMAPAVVMIDEVEKALSGVASSGPTDSGVSARLFGSFLTWLNDHDSDVFVVCTSNDVSKLPPEFARAERFDGTFFLDLPSSAQRERIWRQYLAHFASRRRPAPAPGPRLDRRRDPRLLPPGRSAGPVPDRGGHQHRPGGRHRGRGDREAPLLGQWPVSRRRPTRPLHPRPLPAATDPAARSRANPPRTEFLTDCDDHSRTGRWVLTIARPVFLAPRSDHLSRRPP